MKSHSILFKRFSYLTKKHTWLGRFDYYTDVERIVQSWVGHPAGDLGSWRKTRENGYMRGQGKRPVPVLPMTAQRALVRKEFGLRFRWRKEKPFHLKGKE